jgi:hypothetical protein
MGLGGPIEAHGSSSAYVFPLLTDHPAFPFFENAELTLYEGGFLFEKLNGSTLPGVVSFEKHVSDVWIEDLEKFLRYSENECFKNAAKITTKRWDDVPEGIVVIFRLKDVRFDVSKHSGDADGIEKNPFSAFAPDYSIVRHVAIVIRTDSQSSLGYFNRANPHWKRSMRAHDVTEHKGGDGERSPFGISRSFVSLCDTWATRPAVSGILNGTRTSLRDIVDAAAGPFCFPGVGYFVMR